MIVQKVLKVNMFLIITMIINIEIMYLKVQCLSPDKQIFYKDSYSKLKIYVTTKRDFIISNYLKRIKNRLI